jgi:hypothetical protein
MSFYIGIPVSNRQASPEFALLSQNFRRANNISELKIKVCRPLLTFFYIGFLSIVPWLIASVYGNTLQCLQETPDCKFAVIPQLAEPTFNFCVVTASALTAAILKKCKMVLRKPGGKFSNGAITEGKITSAGALKIVEVLKKENIVLHSETGLGSGSLTFDAVKAMRTLGRLVNGFLHAQPVEEYLLPLSKDNTTWGHIRSTIKLSATDSDKLAYREGKLSAGKDEEFETDASYDVIGVPAFAEEDIFVTVDEVHESSGHCFRFVPFTVPADKEFFAEFLYNHFLYFFADKHTTSKTVIEQFVRNLPAIGSILHGSELIFCLYVISLCIATGGHMQLIRDGSSILGILVITTRHIWRGDVLVAPVDADSIRSTVASWMTISGSRKIIAEVLSKLPVKASKSKVTISSDEIDTLPKLLAAIVARTPLRAMISDLDLAIRSAGYDAMLLSASTDNISLVLRDIFNKITPSDFALSQQLFLNPEPILVANLSRFGVSSVSFNNAGGKAMDVYCNEHDDPNASKTKEITIQTLQMGKKGKKTFKEEKKTVSFYDRLCISRVPIDIAVKDFEAFIESHKIVQLTVYDARVFGNVEVHPLPNGSKSEVIEALRLFGGIKEKFAVKKTKVDFVEADDGGISDEDDGELEF